MAVFVEDPAQSFRELGITMPDLFDTTRAAVLDMDHRTRVNFENFYFVDEASKARFDAKPATYAGILTDPVSRNRFRVGGASPRLEHGGHAWFFESDSSRALFAAEPDSFPVTKARMIPRDAGG